MRKRVTIEWNDGFYTCERENCHFSEEDVTIHDNGWVTVQQQDNVIVHYSPISIQRVTVTEENSL